MTITNREIVERMDALSVEDSRAYAAERARIAKEKQILHELCGGLGHLYSRQAANSEPPARSHEHRCLEQERSQATALDEPTAYSARKGRQVELLAKAVPGARLGRRSEY